MPIRAEISFTATHAATLGRERVRLLEAVGRAGSISGAAREMRITYKAAWDAVVAMNNLFGKPLVAPKTGGKRGGGATLTEDGVRVIATFHRLEAELVRAFGTIEADLQDSGITLSNLMKGFSMRTSARNALAGTVTATLDGAVNAEVRLAISDTTTLTAIITRESMRELGLIPGVRATALIKAPFVILAPAGEAMRTSVRNRIEGTISHMETGAVNSEITLDIGGGKALVAIITNTSARELGFEVGTPVAALIKSSHIILAVE